MAYEVFDDVAFYYLLTTIMAIITVPWTIYKITSTIWSTVSSKSSDLKTDPKNAKKTALASKAEEKKPFFSTGNIVLIVCWVVLIYLMIMLPTYNQSKLASYDPFTELELDRGAGDDEIKRAYRKLSLKFHPDRNQNDPEAAAKFIKISKAYQTLTDPVAKENMEKYGNPDGFKGVSVTIGLPSWLTRKENETRVLLAYFLLFIILPPIMVFVWWRAAKDQTEAGVSHETYKAFMALISQNLSPKFLIEVLAMAAEYRPLTQQPTNADEFKKLYNEVKDSMVKQRFYDPTGKKYGSRFDYVHKGSVLLHAYLQRKPIPASLHADMTFVLKHAHQLLNTMLEVCLMNRPPTGSQLVRPALSVMDLMQLVSQAMWVHDSPLLQLPHFDAKRANKVQTIGQFKRLTKEKREKLWDFTAEQWADIDRVADMLPEIDLSHKVSVEDEEDSGKIYEGDIVTINVSLERIKFDPNRPEGASRASIVDDDEEGAENKKSVIQSTETKSKSSTPSETSIIESSSSSSDNKSDSKSSEADDDNDEDFSLDRLPSNDKKKSVSSSADGVLAHTPYFPYPKREKWVVFLSLKNKNGIPDRFIALSKVPPLENKSTVELKFPAPPARRANDNGGLWEFDLYAVCDSYRGFDKIDTVKIKVEKNPKQDDKKLDENGEVVEKKKSRAGDLATGLFALLQEDENYDGKWYYLGFQSFWELVLNIIVLGLLIVFIFNFLKAKGWWDKYIEPTKDSVSQVVYPYWNATMNIPFVAAVMTPVINAANNGYQWMSNALHREAPVHRRRGTKDDTPEESPEQKAAEEKAKRAADDLDGFGKDDNEENNDSSASAAESSESGASTESS